MQLQDITVKSFIELENKAWDYKDLIKWIPIPREQKEDSWLQGEYARDHEVSWKCL